MHHAMLNRDLNATVMEIRIGMQRELDAIAQVGIRYGVHMGIRGAGDRTQHDCGKAGANGRSSASMEISHRPTLRRRPDLGQQ
jgi:hypothetical protein